LLRLKRKMKAATEREKTKKKKKKKKPKQNPTPLVHKKKHNFLSKNNTIRLRGGTIKESTGTESATFGSPPLEKKEGDEETGEEKPEWKNQGPAKTRGTDMEGGSGVWSDV